MPRRASFKKYIHLSQFIWYIGRERSSNPHEFPRQFLRLVCLPIPPPMHKIIIRCWIRTNTYHITMWLLYYLTTIVIFGFVIHKVYLANYKKSGSDGWDRTNDIRINSPLFYQLNYIGICVYYITVKN